MHWLNEPATWQRTGDVLAVSVDPGTDFWRETGYGYIHDSGHVYGEVIAGDLDVSARIRPVFENQFDQAGVMLRVDDRVWLKTGLELFDGHPRLSTVVTLGVSSWTVTNLPEDIEEITVQVSRRGDAVEIRYVIGAGHAELAALAFLPPDREVLAGIMCAAPGEQGFGVTFHDLRAEPYEHREPEAEADERAAEVPAERHWAQDADTLVPGAGVSVTAIAGTGSVTAAELAADELPDDELPDDEPVASEQPAAADGAAGTLTGAPMVHAPAEAMTAGGELATGTGWAGEAGAGGEPGGMGWDSAAEAGEPAGTSEAGEPAGLGDEDAEDAPEADAAQADDGTTESPALAEMPSAGDWNADPADDDGTTAAVESAAAADDEPASSNGHAATWADSGADVWERTVPVSEELADDDLDTGDLDTGDPGNGTAPEPEPETPPAFTAHETSEVSHEWPGPPLEARPEPPPGPEGHQETLDEMLAHVTPYRDQGEVSFPDRLAGAELLDSRWDSAGPAAWAGAPAATGEPGPVPDLPDPADEWISLLTTDPAED